MEVFAEKTTFLLIVPIKWNFTMRHTAEHIFCQLHIDLFLDRTGLVGEPKRKVP